MVELKQWERREMDRFWDGTYKVVPWEDADFWCVAMREGGVASKHYAHRSAKDESLLAFTENDAKGERDIQTALKPGRYLSRFFSDVLTPAQIAKYAAMFNSAGYELKFATTAKDMALVYEKGPHSCMAGTADEYDCEGYHPTAAYAAGDLAVAYLVCPEGKFTARALCYPAKLKYSRIYGDEYRMEEYLQKAGYSRGNLVGAKMAKIAVGSGYVMPYVDWHGVDDADDHFLIVDEGDGDIDCHRTDGMTYGHACRCESCGERMRDDDAYRNDYGDSYCYSCYRDHYADCYQCGRTVDRDSTITVDGDQWCERCADRHAQTCEHCHETTANENITSDIHGDAICNGCAHDCESCLDTGNIIPDGDTCDCEACQDEDGNGRTSDAGAAERARQERQRQLQLEFEANVAALMPTPEEIERRNQLVENEATIVYTVAAE
jgi:hypothetical protein